MEKRIITADIKNKLFSVIRYGLDISASPLELSENDCSELMRIGAKQSILPIICRGLKQIGVSQAITESFDKAQLKGTYRSIQHDHALNCISSVFDKSMIPYVLLKGAVLRHLYPDPLLRTSSDIDVLVQQDDLDRAVQLLEAETDFKVEKRAYHDISMLSSRVHLELHFSIKENDKNLDGLLIRAWKFARPSGEGYRYVFSPEFQLFHVIAHMSYHFLHGGLGIRPFLDLWLLRTKTQFDENAVRQMCSECRILKFYEECCRLTEVWLEGKEHTETTRALEEFCLSGGVFGSDQFKNAARQKEHRGWKYILSRVFPPASEVREYYQDASEKKHSTAYYYVKRWFKWLGKDKRKDMNRQVRDILSSDQEYLNSTNELLKRLGL